MEKVILGRTGLAVTIAGLGGGGHSRLGIKQYGEQHAAGVVRRSFELGVNFFDTSAAYGTEGVVGLGLEGLPREEIVVSSKFPYINRDGSMKRQKDLMDTLDNCLKQLKMEYVDIYHLHALTIENYSKAIEEFFPALEKAKEQGKIRFFGVTERFASDSSHEMLKKAVEDSYFDVMMVGYNMLNPSAAKTILPITMQKNIGVLCMFAVRTALSNPERLKANLEEIALHGQGGSGFKTSDDIFDFLLENGEAESIINAAYRYCRHTEGINVTLTGTSNLSHLEANLNAIQMPSLSSEKLQQLELLFGNVDCVNAE